MTRRTYLHEDDFLKDTTTIVTKRKVKVPEFLSLELLNYNSN